MIESLSLTILKHVSPLKQLISALLALCFATALWFKPKRSVSQAQSHCTPGSLVIWSC
jgi:hypothetical protein